jgi:hypothetical protein
VILRSAIQPADDPTVGARELQVVAGSYEQGIAEIEGQTPEGWRRLYIIMDRA